MWKEYLTICIFCITSSDPLIVLISVFSGNNWRKLETALQNEEMK